MFSVMERHRKELGILRSDGGSRGRSRRCQEDRSTAEGEAGSWLLAAT